MQKDIIKPYFHYYCKSDAIVTDSQYTFDGSYLAVCTSNASILIYKSPVQQSSINQLEYNPIIEFNNPNKNNCYLKLAWSFFDSSLAAVSISKQITLFALDKDTLKPQYFKKCAAIPVFCSFLPSFEECILSVAYSDGTIGLYNQTLVQLAVVEGHEQSVNWLSWERRLGVSERNKWISEHFPTYVNQQLIKKPPLLASGSSDGHINIWKIQNQSLILRHRFKAHEKQIRQVMWRPNYFSQSKKRTLVSCSEDGYVIFWEISENPNKLQQKMKSQRNFNGPVYRSEYNSLGTLIAISYYEQDQGKVQTKAFIDKQGAFGEEIQFIQ